MKFKFLKYFLTLSIPFLAYVSFNSTGILTYAPILEAFLLIPLLELFFKPSTKNISEAEEEMAKEDISYDIILYLFVPLIYFLIWEFLVFFYSVFPFQAYSVAHMTPCLKSCRIYRY